MGGGLFQFEIGGGVVCGAGVEGGGVPSVVYLRDCLRFGSVSTGKSGSFKGKDNSHYLSQKFFFSHAQTQFLKLFYPKHFYTRTNVFIILTQILNCFLI